MRATTPRAEWPVEVQLEEIAERISAARTQALEDRTKLRATLEGLKSEKSQRKLSELGRQDERNDALTLAKTNVDAYGHALAHAKQALTRRETLVSPARVRREARFVPVNPTDDAPTKLQKQIAEQLMRLNCREELRDATPEELAMTVRDATATQNLAVIDVAAQVVHRRLRAGEASERMRSVLAALNDAEKATELPEDVQTLQKLFTQIDSDVTDLENTIGELTTGQEPAGYRQKSQRVDQIVAEGKGALSPAEVAAVYTAEREAERAERKQRASKRADEIITDAIQTDEINAATIAASIGHNPNPRE